LNFQDTYNSYFLKTLLNATLTSTYYFYYNSKVLLNYTFYNSKLVDLNTNIYQK